MEYPEEHPTPVTRVQGYLEKLRTAQGNDRSLIHSFARTDGNFPLYAADLEAIINDRIDAQQALIDVLDIFHDLERDMFANIPLGSPDKEWDPNDEFKRCARDRAWRTEAAYQKAKKVVSALQQGLSS